MSTLDSRPPVFLLIADSHHASEYPPGATRLLDADPDEIGMEFVVLDSEIFQAITPRDFLQLQPEPN